jgi:hypothetical protein
MAGRYQLLEQAISQRSPALIQLQLDPAFESMRQEPHFLEILRCTGHPV